MPDIYNRPRDYEKEAIASVDEMAATGHDIENGVCKPDCQTCEPYRTSPEQEYKNIIELVKKKLDGPPRLKYFRSIFTLNRTALNELAKHPKAKVEKAKNLPIIITVTLSFTFVSENRHATVVVRGHAPLQLLKGRKPYIPDTMPKPLP